MVDLSALQIAAHVKQHGEGLPEPVALSVNREGQLTLVFARTADLDRWVGALRDVRQESESDLWPGALWYRGYLVTDEGATVSTSLVLP